MNRHHGNYGSMDGYVHRSKMVMTGSGGGESYNDNCVDEECAEGINKCQLEKETVVQPEREAHIRKGHIQRNYVEVAGKHCSSTVNVTVL